MASTRDLDWEALHPIPVDALVAAKRAIDASDSDDPGWRIRVVQLREAREDAREDAHRAAAHRSWANPEFQNKAANARRKAWEAGKYDNQRGKQRNPELTLKMLELRNAGCSNVEIAERLGCSPAAVWLRIKGRRKNSPAGQGLAIHKRPHMTGKPTCNVFWGKCNCGTWHCQGVPDGDKAEDECRRQCGLAPKLRIAKCGGKP